MAELHLFHLPGACSRVTLTALELTGAPYQVTVPKMHRGELGAPAYRDRNPLGQVPTLLIDGRPLAENVAILFTLARLFPDAGLLPLADPVQDGIALSRLAICSSQLHPCVTRIIFPERFCDVSPDAAARVRAQSEAMLLTRLGAIEPTLAKQPFWLGDAYSIADSYLLWITGRMIRLGLDFSSLPALAAHAERVRDVEVSRRVLEKEAGYLKALEDDGGSFPPHVRATMAA